MSRRAITLFVASFVMLVLVCVAALMPVPYVTMKPGPTFNTLGEFENKPVLEFGQGIRTYPTNGALRFTTVSVTSASSRLSLGQAVSGWFDSDEAVVPRDVIYPEGQTAEEAEQETSLQMASSKSISEAVALREAGYDVGVVVQKPIDDKGPAAGKLEVGDRIVAVDGDQIDSPDDVVTDISTLKPGTDVTLDIERGDAKRSVELTTEPYPGDDSASRIGIGIDYDFPISITNNVGQDIGGPSAGTMFALAMYDELSPGSLTGGNVIAGTGTISDDGTVGPIGGIQQKTAGAAAAGAKVFLVPSGNCEEAADGGDHGMELVRIDTFKRAVDSLEKLADDPDAEVPLCN